MARSLPVRSVFEFHKLGDAVLFSGFAQFETVSDPSVPAAGAVSRYRIVPSTTRHDPITSNIANRSERKHGWPLDQPGLTRRSQLAGPARVPLDKIRICWLFAAFATRPQTIAPRY
jgi:hypothetical protein